MKGIKQYEFTKLFGLSLVFLMMLTGLFQATIGKRRERALELASIPTATAIPTETPRPTTTPSPTAMPTETATQTPTATPTSTPTPVPWNQIFDSYVSKIGSPNLVDAVDETSVLGQESRISADYDVGVIEHCEMSENVLYKSIEDFIILDPNMGELYPGAIVQSAPLIQDGLIQRVNLPRSSATLIIDGLRQKDLSVTIDEASPGSILSAINDLLPDDPTETVADFDVKYVAVHSKDQAGLALGLSADATSGFFGGIEFSPGGSRSAVLVRMVQTYYTVTYDSPSRPSRAFEPISLAQAGEFMALGNAPAYISSVSYGRYLTFAAFAEMEPRDLKAAIEYQLQGVVPIGYSRIGLGEALEEVTYHIRIEGGSATNASRFIESKDLDQFVLDGAMVSADSRGVPLAYRAAYLHNHQPIRVANSAEYRATTCTTQDIPPSRLRVTLNDICIKRDGEGLVGGKADVTFDFNVVIGEQQLEVMSIGNDSPLRVSRDAQCQEPHTIDASQSVRLPTQNGRCFAIDGTFRDKQLLTGARLIGTVQNEICFQNGHWVDLTGARISTLGRQFTRTLDGGNAEWEVRYTVEQLDE